MAGGACGTHGASKGAYRVLVRKTEGKRPTERPRRTCENNITMGTQHIGRRRELD